MNTKVFSKNEIDKAAEIIKNGGLVAMPTETVYGLAADALNGNAVAKIFKAKGRPMDNPLIVHIARVEDIYGLVSDFPEKAQALAKAFWPGPLTMVLPKADVIPDEVSAGLDTVAIRFPSHPLAQELIKRSVPLAAPSANLSGSPSPTTAKHVIDDMNGRIDAVIDGGDCDVGLESTVISLAVEPPRLLRPGGVTLEQLQNIIGEVVVDPAVLQPLKDGQKVSSPGMKYKHYSPKADVVLVDGTKLAFERFVKERLNDKTAVLCYDDEKEVFGTNAVTLGTDGNYEAQAHSLFSALRKADERGFSKIYAHCPEQKGVGLAVYNRIIRAAGFKVIKV